jgi:hypothetical protein
MEHRIDIEEHASQQVVHAWLKGPLSEDDRNRVGAEAIAAMRASGASRILWDIREAVLTYPLIGSHKAVLSLEALGLTDDDRLAVIYHLDKRQHEHAKLVAQNRGIFNVGYFESPDDGIAWLTRE